MKCSVFIATSADGYIATKEGGVEWLSSSGKQGVDLGDEADMGFGAFISGVDCMIMGRKCMEVLSRFNLPPEQWPYGDIRIIVLSRTVNRPPENLKNKVEMYSGDIPSLLSRLDEEGYGHAYIDGGTTITSFINLKLINDICITQAPILLGAGLPLFGSLGAEVRLENACVRAFANDFVQLRYQVSYL
ncbi:MAG: dihydrofolate reductase family protein [Agarilytica sp.]